MPPSQRSSAEGDAGILHHRLQHFAGLKGGRLQRRARQVTLAGEARQPADQAARALVPAGRVEPGEGRHDHGSAVVRHRSREPLDIGAGGDQAEIVAQPLHEGAGDGDGALERVDRLRRAEPVGEGREKPAGGRGGRLADIHEHEAAGAVGVLGLAGLEAGLADERRLLIAEDAGDGQTRQRPHGLAVHLARRDDPRQAGARDVEQAQDVGVPLQRLDVHELRAAGVGHVGDVEPSVRPAGQVPDEPGIDRAEQGVAGLRLLARTGDVGEQPMQLEAGKIARQRQAGLGAQAILAAVGREARHQVVDARVLPDERVAERLAGAPIPQKRGLALVRDADRGEVADG